LARAHWLTSVGWLWPGPSSIIVRRGGRRDSDGYDWRVAGLFSPPTPSFRNIRHHLSTTPTPFSHPPEFYSEHHPAILHSSRLCVRPPSVFDGVSLSSSPSASNHPIHHPPHSLCGQSSPSAVAAKSCVSLRPSLFAEFATDYARRWIASRVGG